MIRVGLDIGSTTVKAVVERDGDVVWRDYQRHNTHQAATVAAYLQRMEDECGVRAGNAAIYATGSGAGLIGPLVGAKFIQEVVAVAAAVERLHPTVRFVSEIGGEDMKTLFFTPAEGTGASSPAPAGSRKIIPIHPAQGRGAAPSGEATGPATCSGVTRTTKQVYMQSACSGGTGTFIEKTARKLEIDPERLAAMNYLGRSLHAISAKCGIFAEADANTLVKSGVPVEEIVASLFEAVVYQNLATLTKGNTPLPEVLLLGGPNLFFSGLQQAWRYHLEKLWRERGIDLPGNGDPASLIHVPQDALYYACLGCLETARYDQDEQSSYPGLAPLMEWIDYGQHEQKAREGTHGLVTDIDELARFQIQYGGSSAPSIPAAAVSTTDACYVGCDFGSTTAKAVVIDAEANVLHSSYVASRGNPIEDAIAIFARLYEAGYTEISRLAITGYGKDLLRDILGADVAIVETVAHASAAVHFFPHADCICDVGGCDVKIMLLRQGTVADFRLNSQCSSGNGAFLQGVAERYGVPLEDYAEKAFAARAIPDLAMGCGVFLQSDIVNQQRKGWSGEEIMAALAAVLPQNVWVYAGQLQNLAAVGRYFVLQGGTHRNLAVVKAQVDFIRAKVPDAEIVVHPYPGEAGAIGAALCARASAGETSRFRGFETIAALTYRSTTDEHTVCHWCPVSCRRTFIDVALPGAQGRPWSKVPLETGWQRVISGNSCPKGLFENADEMREVKTRMEETQHAYPNIADTLRESAFKPARATRSNADRDPEGPERMVYASILDRILARARV